MKSKAITPIAAAIIVLVLLVSVIVLPMYMYYSGLGYGATGGSWGLNPNGQTTTTTVSTGTGAGGLRTDKMEIGVQNFDNSSSITTASTPGAAVDISPTVDLVGSTEKGLALSSYPTLTGQQYTENDQYYFNVYADGYIPQVYRATIGGAVERMVISYPPVGNDGVSFSNPATITWESYTTMKLSNEATPTWVLIKPLTLKYAAVGTDVQFELSGPGGQLRIVKGDGAGANEPAAGSQVSNYTALGKTFDLHFVIRVQANSEHYGDPFVVISATSSPYVFQARYLVLWMAVNNTQINSASLTGFTPIAVQPVGYWVGYRILQAVDSTQTATASSDLTIPFDEGSVSSSSVLKFQFWVGTQQFPIDVKNGGRSAVPTAYGSFAGYGTNPVLPAQTYTIVSNIPAASELSAYLTTF